MAIKITIQSVSGADYFKFKEYPSEFFESKTKSYELYRNKNSNTDGNKILFSARNVNSGEYLFSNVAVEEVEAPTVCGAYISSTLTFINGAMYSTSSTYPNDTTAKANGLIPNSIYRVSGTGNLKTVGIPTP